MDRIYRVLNPFLLIHSQTECGFEEAIELRLEIISFNTEMFLPNNGSGVVQIFNRGLSQGETLTGATGTERIFSIVFLNC